MPRVIITLTYLYLYQHQPTHLPYFSHHRVPITHTHSHTHTLTHTHSHTLPHSRRSNKIRFSFSSLVQFSEARAAAGARDVISCGFLTETEIELETGVWGATGR